LHGNNRLRIITASVNGEKERKLPMKPGVLVRLEDGPEAAIAKVRDLQFLTCQVVCWDASWLTAEIAGRLASAARADGIEITTLWVGLPGRHVWDFLEGPTTIGLVPPATRAERLDVLKRGSDFARHAGLSSITTHAGFIPETPTDPLYADVLAALREIATYCLHNDQWFWFETGQETPVVLLRVIENLATGNLGINLDPANLLMYGKANPVDALDIVGGYIRGVHAKDGEYPTNGSKLGVEKPLGEGRVNFPLLLRKLQELGYNGALTIEREISGPRQIEDIRTGKAYLEQILASL
jgi:sugar phosphate isomerase/epimerase